MKLKDKTALITGASTGIGRQTAITLASRGVRSIITARSKDRLIETQKQINNLGGNADIVEADLSNISSLEKLINKIKSLTEHIDYICNIAGIWHGEDELFAAVKYEDFRTQTIIDTLNVGVISPMVLIHGLVSMLLENSVIINLSGTFESGSKGWLPYYVSKRAIEDLTVGLSEELKDKNINVFGVSPSDTATQSYKKYFPQYIDDAINPNIISEFIANLCQNPDPAKSGKIFVMKKGQNPTEKFHA